MKVAAMQMSDVKVQARPSKRVWILLHFLRQTFTKNFFPSRDLAHDDFFTKNC